MVARSRPEAFTEAARPAGKAGDWERDREAWNLPRAPRGTIAGGVDENDQNVGPGEQGAGPPAISAETAE